MPREYVHANYVTVRAGDLSAVPPSQLDPHVVSSDVVARDLLGRLRRQLDVHRAFEAAARATLDGLATDADDATHGELRHAVDALRRRVVELDRSLAHATSHATAVRTGGEDGDTGDDTGDDDGGEESDRSLGSGLDVGPDLDHVEAALAEAGHPAAATDAPRRLQLRVSLTWESGGGQVVLGVDGVAPDGTPVNLGGYHAALDWRASNLLVATARTARDGANGTPA